MMKRIGPARALAVDLVPAAMMGCAVATLVMLAPIELIERLAVRSGAARLIPQARPPLGLTARGLAAGAGFAGAALAVFVALRLIERLPRRRSRPVRAAIIPGAPDLRLRRGAPLPATARPMVHAATELPAGLFTAETFSPAAPVQAVLEPVVVGPVVEEPVRHAPPPPAWPDAPGNGSIADLLARLEGGMASPQAAR